MTKKKKIVTLVFLSLLLLVFAGTGLWLFWIAPKKEVNEGYERMKIEESLADEYVQQMVEGVQSGKSDWEPKETTAATGLGHTEEGRKEPEKETEETPGEKDPYDYEDTVWHVAGDGSRYTPDYALGYLASVLEVPSAKIRRGVYCSDNPDELEHDLDCWMVVYARTDIRLSPKEEDRTAVLIMGHNVNYDYGEDLSFNHLQTDVKIGDTFRLTSEGYVYNYEVVNLFSVGRETFANDYVVRMPELDSDKCYLATCGRDLTPIGGSNHRYKEFVVEGNLVSIEKAEDVYEKRNEENKEGK